MKGVRPQHFKVWQETNSFLMTPNSQFTLPPEWAPQSAVMLTWPHAYDEWAPFLEEIDPVFVNIARAIAPREKVLITCYDAEHQAHVGHLLKKAQVELDQVRFGIAKSNDIWVRDHGPITVLTAQHRPLLLDFEFNAWGGKYDLAHDNWITRTLHQQKVFGSTPLQHIDFTLEGGGIEVDGQGTLLATESVLLSATRNKIQKEELQANLKQWFNIDRVLWLKNGYLAGDDTDGHIDTLARFTDAHTVAYATCEDPNDPHYPVLRAMEAELAGFRDYQGNPYRLVGLPIPQQQYSSEGELLPATYANFLIINEAVLLPIYGDPMDSVALARLQGCFPTRKVIPIQCRVLINLYGSLHCATMQLPKG